MKVEQIYTSCLAQGAYYIESNGEVAIVDPLREVQPYIDMAESRGAKIKYILETHFHADFVSGHVTLAEKTGATIVYGPNANTGFEAKVAEDGETLPLGNTQIVVLHTPGHTMESTTFLLRDADGKDTAIFSGDTLFLGDVGRPDLAQKAASMTQEELAGTLFDSLRNKIMTLADDVTVYPGHGAGSACGKNMMKETVDTLGNQKQMNYALRADMTREEFIKEVTDGLMPPPSYFPMNVKMNKEGYEDIENVLDTGLRAMDAGTFEAVAESAGAMILDVRSEADFAKGFIPQSVFIGLDGTFAPWVGALIKDVKQPILLVAPEGKEEETVTRLARVGFDNTLGYLKGELAAWKAAGKEVDTLETVSATTFATESQREGTVVVDVRKPGEYSAEHVSGAKNIPLDFLNEQMAEVPTEGKFFVHCAGGYRSVIASSILKARGYHNMINVEGGIEAIIGAGVEVTDYVCPSTLK